VTSWAYRLQPSDGQSRADYVAEQGSEPFDILVTDYAYDGTGGTALTESEVDSIRSRTGGFVLAYLSIGEAESYRYYWQGWGPGNPDFVGPENPDWPGNYKVRYWDPDWQQTIFGSSGAYLDRILDAGFDGVYLDIIDAYECWESGACAP
jgi:cysteinyl-tRNA synthetase